ncbi:N-acetyl-1-D-myo-inositol-2-amino-2-deoxy-alpha-D-glucopyranoside deacetylase [Leucobacter exalbidus]|uniref:N-acetyl-1-D-myo-inositol-2-amino-2-deoxy-alpha-D-glucopyranoside deacetylase n=1 Tax=Leucobacter exalbidus TaxID=662960 RepID=A0A940PNZ5_9MICO|nr:PIG-L family deacetylase [Leucobacter exalbidus]MBP1326545.1 N-acetyl-1-D-myo-inositol-2-amino-2-deoxy-alpha-D-glucopyranoside deacetylase [Leucobacter exalbidus]
MTNAQDWFDGRARVMFVHAHPDDETITTGGTLAALAEAGREPLLVTLTRGERGEVVPGPFSSLEGTDGLAPHRQAELTAALVMLGLERHVFLGVDPARAEGRAPYIYEDSGMEWAEIDPAHPETPPRAIPASNVGPDALTSVPVVEPLTDLLTAAQLAGAQAIVSYDDGGGYGHPDHVLAHRLSRAIADALGLPFWEIVSEDSPAAPVDDTARVEIHDVTPWMGRKISAMHAYGTQLTVDGDSIVHVGGQRERIEHLESFRLVTGRDSQAE